LNNERGIELQEEKEGVDNVKTYTVLATGVGAIIGYGIVRSLRAASCPVKIIGMDIYSDAVGQHWCDGFEQAVPANSPKYGDFIKSIVREHRIDLIIPGIEQDVQRLSEMAESLRTSGICLALNDAALIKTANDKWLMHNTLVDHGFSSIKTFIDGAYGEMASQLGVPFLMKPRRSYASKGIQKIENETEYSYWKRKSGENFMVQEIVGDDESEYTAGAFGYGDGLCTAKIIFQRKLSGEGATAKAKVKSIPELDVLIDRLVRLFRPVGPTNFQFRCHKGEYLLLEINPRISSSTSLRAAFGYNEAKMCLEYYLEGKRPTVGELRTGFATRYIEDMVFYDRDHF
jgi:carbamoyl-phosphate synthase large subunit